jgi:regulator of sigma E protease
MVVVSAGVIMNVILAALLFMALFIMGHKIQPPIVGAVLTNSPAQLAGMQVGDRVQTFDGSEEHSFTGLMYDMILVRNAKSVPMDVQRTLYANGKRRTETVQLEVQPAKPTADSGSFYAIGIEGIAQLKSVPADTDIGKIQLDPKTQLLPGDVITAVNGTPVGLDDYPLLAQAFQRSDGQPVSLTVKDKTGQDRNVMAAVHFQRFFGEDSPFKLFNIAGMQAQPQITHVLDASPMKGKLKDGDVIAGIFINGDPKPYPSNAEFSAAVADAHARKLKVDFLIDRGGKYERIEGAVPDVKLGEGQGRGVGLGLDVDSSRPVVTNVIADSAAEKAKIPRGALVLKINDTPVNTWFDVHRLLRDAGNAASLTYALLGSDGHLRADTQATLKLDLEKDHEALTRIQYAPGALLLAERTELRQTRNPLTAARWGVIETRDMLRQFYVTLRRVIEGRVSPTNFMGPVGIVYNGSRIAFRGWDYLLWFLAMISANLAVVNFLPIPIVDGGLFVFLIFEKVSGRPLSPRMQTVAQLVGLAIILSVFLLVTYQDIRRMFM